MDLFHIIGLEAVRGGAKDLKGRFLTTFVYGLLQTCAVSYTVRYSEASDTTRVPVSHPKVLVAADHGNQSHGNRSEETVVSG